jgi:hypothetical protein
MADGSTRWIDQESWTRGSYEQRQAWFTTGYKSGNVGDCDTFSRRGPPGRDLGTVADPALGLVISAE